MKPCENQIDMFVKETTHNKKRILVACEESQAVTIELRKLGHEAYSCDIMDCSGGYPEWHIKQDVLPLLDGNCGFRTCDNVLHKILGQWDMIIAFPPCTYLTVTGNSWFNISKYGINALNRYALREKAIRFFLMFVNADCEHIAIENPVGIMSTVYHKPNQIIQPYFFGDSYEKRTCLWLKGLEKLRPTGYVLKPVRKIFASGKSMASWYADSWGNKNRAILRSKTFPGIAKAMATQWAGKIMEDL